MEFITIVCRLGLGALLAAAGCVAASGGAPSVNDVTQLNPIPVERIVAPRSADEVARLVRDHRGPVCIGGARHSQGGQIATPGCLFLDMRHMDRILALDTENRTIAVEAGITWRQIQEAIDPKQLSVEIMQAYSNFTVGGSLSVNAHGAYVGRGPVVASVLSFDIVLADGSVVTASRTKNRDIFDGAIGGYGGLGVIVAATLQLVPNERVLRVAKTLPLSQYKDYYQREVARDPRAVFHSAFLYPPDYDTVTAVTFVHTDKKVTVKERLAPEGTASAFDRFLMGWLADGPMGKSIREYIYDPILYDSERVEWRNYEASYDARSLEPASRKERTYVLQEYFVPPDRFSDFVKRMASILHRSNANVLNATIRHAEADRETLLAWAPSDMFALVLYFEQGTQPSDRDAVGKWTDALIEAALEEGGTYYLPYQIVASRDQFLRAYPRAPDFFKLKARLDPTCKFRNRLWDVYDDAPASRAPR